MASRRCARIAVDVGGTFAAKVLTILGAPERGFTTAFDAILRPVRPPRSQATLATA